MIRDEKLIDKLIADLHFHNFLFVAESDDLFTESNKDIEQKQFLLKQLGLDNRINAHVDLYHGGDVLTDVKSDYINEFIDDVFIDYFFRTFSFKKIIFPVGFCHEHITPNGVSNPTCDLELNLNDIYDRCTFANNIFRLFCIDNYLVDKFPNNGFFKSFDFNFRTYGLHSWCDTIANNKTVYWIPLEHFLSKYYPRKLLAQTNHRGQTIKEYISFLHNEERYDYFGRFSPNYLIKLSRFEKGYSEIKDNNLFGEYTIQDILLIYSLLIDKFLLTDTSFLLSLCHCAGEEIMANEFLNDFIHFEKVYQSSEAIEQYIRSKDLYLRFASHDNSKAFTFEPINDTLSQIYFFGKKSALLLMNSNTLPLPHLYNLKSN